MSDANQSSTIDDLVDTIVEYLKAEEGLTVSGDDREIPLSRFGLDSVAVIGLSEFINKKYMTKIPQHIVYDNPTLNKIAEFIVSQKK